MEIQAKYDNPAVWEMFTDLFDFFPICAIIDNKFICLHAGISPFLESKDDLLALNRFSEIPQNGPYADLMWSDPDDKNSGFTLSPRLTLYLMLEEQDFCMESKC